MPAGRHISNHRIKGPSVSEALLLNQLEDLADKLGIKVRYENLNLEESSSAGGLCRLKGDYLLIIQAQASVKEKMQVLIEVLKRFPLGDLYIRAGSQGTSGRVQGLDKGYCFSSRLLTSIWFSP